MSTSGPVGPPDAARLVRAPVVRILDRHDSLTLVGRALAHRLPGDSASLARAVLDFTLVPRARGEILEHLAALSGAPVPEAAVDDLVALLRAEGILVTAPATIESSERCAPAPAAARRLVLCVSGAIAAAHAPLLVGRLLERGFTVRVALTRSAHRLVSADALAALTHEPVHTRFFSRDPAAPAPHVLLAEWAEAVLVCPASATTLARVAAGECSTLVAAVAIATRAPVLLVPSMSAGMWRAPAVQRNVDTLRGDGFAIVHPAFGVEVAHAPSARRPLPGAAPPMEDVVDLLEAMLALPAPVDPAVEGGKVS